MSTENPQLAAVIDEQMLHRMQHATGEAERRELAEPLWGAPRSAQSTSTTGSNREPTLDSTTPTA